MKLLLDQGLPRSAVEVLRQAGVEAMHVGDIGLASAEDRVIIDHARHNNQMIVTLDADFHALLAASQSARPSVIRIREEGLNATGLSELLLRILAECEAELREGAMVSATRRRIRLKKLPLLHP